MLNIGRRAATALILISTFTVALPTVGWAPGARAGELYGRMEFTASDVDYELTDRNGRFTARIDWSSAANTIAWSFRPSPAVQAIAAGPMDCKAGHMQLNYSDSHTGIVVGYFWHSSVRGSLPNIDYSLYGSCSFPVVVDGRSGMATLGFHFKYILK